ncbi:hypothetical protein N784_14000 [Pontibacillus litoralis JSM 072002]|uniref:Uncharacterized protein n=1 Tax=Pontibacillus litoralis JSM 072002 TaxID=1385512 RepID=A0A0A5G3V7_9BACI|nr:hypothetical protein N784_14000 [Pontibacillus litoralis JSM 072002]
MFGLWELGKEKASLLVFDASSMHEESIRSLSISKKPKKE